MKATRLYIPPRTRLETIWRTFDDVGQIHWHVYTACRDRNAPWEQMEGTALQLDCDGVVTRYTEGADVMLNMIEVMPNVMESE